jgi:cell division protein FtsW
MRYLNDFSIKKGIIPVSLICMLVLGLIFIGKDWGTTFLLGAASAFVFFAAGLKFRYLLFPIIIFMPLGVFYIKNYDAERWSRMTTYLNPEAVHKTDGYQLWNSLLALGSGGWGGLGFMESRMKAKYLPEAHTDFILSIVGEELGYAGLLAVLFLYASFMFFALRISIKAGNKQGMLLGVGITSLLALQAVINIGVISGALPTKGMPAPFISYGGSNLVMALSGVGLLVSIGVDSVYPGFNRELLFDIKSKFFSLFGKDQ